MRAAVRIGWAALAAGVWTQGASAEATEWLAQISEAARTANYQGMVVYRDGEMLETLQLVHRWNNGEERERLVSMTGEPREILRRDDQITVIIPAARRITVENQSGKGLFPAMSQETVAGLREYYDFRELGKARVAGRVSRGVRIRPKDAFRYGYDVWADEKTGVPLKISLTNRSGRVLEELMFTEVRFPESIPDLALEPEIDATGFEVIAQKVTAPTDDTSVWAVRQLPPGFHVKARDLRVLPGNRGVVEHLLISDGLSAVSIFSASTKVPERQLSGTSQMGAMHAYGRVVGSFHVTVVGEVPAETVRMIGDNINSSAAPAERQTAHD